MSNGYWSVFSGAFENLSTRQPRPQHSINACMPKNGHIADNISYDDVIKWKHFPRYWPFVRGIPRSLVNSPHKGQWRRALMLSLICVWINGWLNNREAGDLWRHRVNYDVIVMTCILMKESVTGHYLHQLMLHFTAMCVAMLTEQKYWNTCIYKNWTKKGAVKLNHDKKMTIVRFNAYTCSMWLLRTSHKLHGSLAPEVAEGTIPDFRLRSRDMGPHGHGQRV